MPYRAAKPIRRGTLTRDAARRQAVDVLRLGESMCAYAAAQLSNGLSPEAATRAALDVAAELAITASSLRRLALARLSPAERRALAVRLVGDGVSRRAAAGLLGCAESTVRADLRRAQRLGRQPAASRTSFPKQALDLRISCPVP